MGKYQIGDKVQVKYMTDQWIDAYVAEVTHITEERANSLKKHYPDIKAGDELLICGQSPDDTDTRGFLPGHGQVRPWAEAVAEATAAEKMQTLAPVKTMAALRPRKLGQ